MDVAALRAQAEGPDGGAGLIGAESARRLPPAMDAVAANSAFCRPSLDTFLSVIAGGDLGFWRACVAALWPCSVSGAVQISTGVASLVAIFAA